MNETTPQSAPSMNPQMLIPGAILLAGLLVAGAVVWDKQPSVGGPLGGNEPVGGAEVDIKDVNTNDSPFVGNANAPVVIAYWADYQCPFCKRFQDETYPQIKSAYIDTGKARIVFKDLAFLGPDSQTAALYGRAVWDLYPSSFGAWHEAMYDSQDEEHGGFGDEPTVQALTRTVAGIDAAKVIAAVKANKSKYEALIAADRSEAQALGLSSTPSFVIGTRSIVGAQGYSNFEAAIEAVL